MNKPSPRPTVDLPVHAFATHTHSPRGAPQHPAADNRSQLVNEQRANQLGQKLNGEWNHVGLTVALSGNFGKAGNPGCGSSWESGSGFPAFSERAASCTVCEISYASSDMHNSTDPNQIPVTWETNASPDRHALLKAVALVFHRTIPLSTAVDLTELDKTLSCERTDP